MKKTVLMGLVALMVLVTGLVAYAYYGNNSSRLEEYMMHEKHHGYIGREAHNIKNGEPCMGSCNNTHSTITVTGVIKDIDYSGWIHIIAGDQEYNIVVKGWWENNISGRIPFTSY